MSKTTGFSIAALALAAVLAAPDSGRAADPEALGFERTPPRLSFVDGDVSFHRPGAEDWSEAEVNTPLAAGDELYAAPDATLEVQIGERAYLRAGEETQLALDSLEPDFLQIRVTGGHVSLDLRTLKASQTFEIDTPNAAFTIERSGYYRVEVEHDTTTFITRRGGRASVTPARGATGTIAPSEQVVISGIDAPQLETYAAPELDAWDRWNYARTDGQLDAVSARYVPAGVYGVDDLDHWGDWRVVPTYGAIWVPRRVAVGWAPYTTGRWIYDPYYGWTWVDAAPWGWAPYHYGRWVHVSGYWGWAPGPLVVRPYYAPALVAFFGGGASVSVSVGVPFPHIGWVALGWGEPLVPWWGPRGCRGVPRWGGWGGPRYVNKVVVHKTVHVREIHVYEHQHRRHAFVAVDRDAFGRRNAVEARLASAEPKQFHRFEGDLDVRPARESLAPSTRSARRPSKEWRERTVIATREPKRAQVPELDTGGETPRSERAEARREASPVRVVERSRRPEAQRTLERPPFGTRGQAERATPPPAPRYEQARRREATQSDAVPEPEKARPERADAPTPKPVRTDRAAKPAHEPSRRERVAAPATPSRRAPPREEAAHEAAADLPGEPANRVYRSSGSTPRSAGGPPAARDPEADGSPGGPRRGKR
jgi:hypothetical protein